MKIFTIPNQRENDELETKLAEYSDYAICMGGITSNKTNGKNFGFFAAQQNDQFFSRTENELEKLIGCRVAIEPELINKLSHEIVFFKSDTELIIGEYPQRAVSLELSKELDELLKQRKLIDTGKKYTTKVGYDYKNKQFDIDVSSEYYYNGKKYVQIKPQNLIIPLEKRLSNGQNLKEDEMIWCEVEPIEFTVFGDMWATVKCLFSGIPYSLNMSDPREGLDKSFLNTYLNSIFLTDMTPRGYEMFLKSQKKELTHKELMIMISFYQYSDYTHFKMIREILKNYSQEYLTLFESSWVQSDFEKAKELEDIRRKENLPKY